jgi:hypothetical protein
MLPPGTSGDTQLTFENIIKKRDRHQERYSFDHGASSAIYRFGIIAFGRLQQAGSVDTASNHFLQSLNQNWIS